MNDKERIAREVSAFLDEIQEKAISVIATKTGDINQYTPLLNRQVFLELYEDFMRRRTKNVEQIYADMEERIDAVLHLLNILTQEYTDLKNSISKVRKEYHLTIWREYIDG